MKTENFSNWLNKHVKPTELENTFIPAPKKNKIRIQSSVDEGKGLDFNQKAQHIFGLIKTMK
jgi:hypothetical protein